MAGKRIRKLKRRKNNYNEKLQNYKNKIIKQLKTANSKGYNFHNCNIKYPGSK